MRTTEL